MLRWQEQKGDGYWARRRGKLDEAEGFYRAALDDLAKDEKWLLERLTTMNTLADLCNEKGDHEQAIDIARSLLSQRRSISANDDIRLGGDLMFLAMSLARQGESSEAVQLAEEGVRIYRAVFGFLPGSACPHYDGKAERRPAYHTAIEEGLPGGYAADDGAALYFRGTELVEVVSSREGASAYRVELVDGRVEETRLEARYLGRPDVDARCL